MGEALGSPCTVNLANTLIADSAILYYNPVGVAFIFILARRKFDLFGNWWVQTLRSAIAACRDF
jgi:hypothetical protein